MQTTQIKTKCKIFDDEGFFVKSKLNFKDKSILENVNYNLSEDGGLSIASVVYNFVLDKDGNKMFEQIDGKWEQAKEKLLDTDAIILFEILGTILKHFKIIIKGKK